MEETRESALTDRRPICLGCWPKYLKRLGKPYGQPEFEYDGVVRPCHLCGLVCRAGVWSLPQARADAE